MSQKAKGRISLSGYWLKEIDEWQQSGQSGADYCRSKGHVYSTFMNRVYRNRKELTPKLVAVCQELIPEDVASSKNQCVDIKIRIGVMVVEIPAGFDSQTLSRTLSVLKQVG